MAVGFSDGGGGGGYSGRGYVTESRKRITKYMKERGRNEEMKGVYTRASEQVEDFGGNGEGPWD